MTCKEYGQWLKECARDPLWLAWAAAIWVSALMSLFDYFGVLSLSNLAFSLIRNACQLLFWLPLILCAVRGRSLGGKNEMTLEARFGYLAFGTIMVVFALETFGATITSILAG